MIQPGSAVFVGTKCKLSGKSNTIEFADHDPLSTHHPSWIATSTATRHGGTHRFNRLLRATAHPRNGGWNPIQSLMFLTQFQRSLDGHFARLKLWSGAWPARAKPRCRRRQRRSVPQWAPVTGQDATNWGSWFGFASPEQCPRYPMSWALLLQSS